MVDISIDGVRSSFASRGIMVSRHNEGSIHIILGPGVFLTLSMKEFEKIISCAEAT